MVYVNDDFRESLIEEVKRLAPMKDITPKDTKPVGVRGPLTADEKAKMKVGSGSTNPTSSKQQKIKEALKKRKKLKETEDESDDDSMNVQESGLKASGSEQQPGTGSEPKPNTFRLGHKASRGLKKEPGAKPRKLSTVSSRGSQDALKQRLLRKHKPEKAQKGRAADPDPAAKYPREG